jgi:spoIIIJ-associated protein
MTEKKGILGFLKNLTQSEPDTENKTKNKTTTTATADPLPPIKKELKNVVTDEIQEFAIKKCQEILTLANFEGTVQLRQKRGYTLNLEIINTGDDSGRVIGKNGSYLQALQTLIKFFIIRKFETSLRLVIDAGDYKNKHQSQMKKNALRSADHVIKTGENTPLDPMNADDRKAIHLLFENHNDIITESEGEGERRHIVLMKRNDNES